MCPTERRGASTEAEIRQQTVPSTFAAETAFLVAAERTGRIEFVVSVRPHHARAELVHDLENLAPLVGPNARAQSVGVLFARAIASSGVRKVITLRTGPKISSCAIRCEAVTPVKKLGGYQ